MGRLLFKDDISKLLDNQTLDQVIHNLTKLGEVSYGNEILKLKMNEDYEPMVGFYANVIDIPSDVNLNRLPSLNTHKCLVGYQLNNERKISEYNRTVDLFNKANPNTKIGDK